MPFREVPGLITTDWGLTLTPSPWKTTVSPNPAYRFRLSRTSAYGSYSLVRLESLYHAVK